MVLREPLASSALPLLVYDLLNRKNQNRTFVLGELKTDGLITACEPIQFHSHPTIDRWNGSSCITSHRIPHTTPPNVTPLQILTSSGLAFITTKVGDARKLLDSEICWRKKNSRSWPGNSPSKHRSEVFRSAECQGLQVSEIGENAHP